MKRIATALTVVCLTFFLSGCGKSQPTGGDESGDAKVNTTPPTVSLGSGSSDADDGSTNPFEDEDAANEPSASDPNPATAQKPATSQKPKDETKSAPGNKKPAAKEVKQ